MKRFSFFLQEEENLQEGINDPNLFKAIFMAGGPGAGKSFVSTKATDVTQGLKVINSDTALQFLLSKAGMSKKMIGMTPEELENFEAWNKILEAVQVKDEDDLIKCYRYWKGYRENS